MALCAWGMSCLIDAAGIEVVGRSIAPATILLSVAVAIVVQLWVKLNELSALAFETKCSTVSVHWSGSWCFSCRSSSSYW
jgi:hypothetical protein